MNNLQNLILIGTLIGFVIGVLVGAAGMYAYNLDDPDDVYDGQWYL